jgi:hypothetical protein
MEKGLEWQKTLPPGSYDKEAGRADYPWPVEQKGTAIATPNK